MNGRLADAAADDADAAAAAAAGDAEADGVDYAASHADDGYVMMRLRARAMLGCCNERRCSRNGSS